MGELQSDHYELNREERQFLEQLYIQNKNKLFDYATLYLDRSSAEEAVQNVFLDACKPEKIRRLIAHDEPQKWLYKALKFSISKIRRTKQQFAKLMIYMPPEGNSEFGIEKGINDFPDERPVDENLDLLYSDLAECDEFQLIKEFAVDDKSLKDMAEKYGVNIGTIEQRLYRARMKLWKLFNNRKNT